MHSYLSILLWQSQGSCREHLSVADIQRSHSGSQVSSDWSIILEQVVGLILTSLHLQPLLPGEVSTEENLY